MIIPEKIKTVLIVDDDPGIIQTVFNFFSQEAPHYKLLSAPNGKLACEIALEMLPDLIILDWEMPIMTGLETIHFLQQKETTQHIPIILATAVNTEDAHLKKALEMGAFDFLRKPFSATECIARAQNAIRVAALYQQERALMQSVIAHQNRELSMITAQMAQKNQLFNEVQKELLDVAANKQSLKKVIKTLQETQQLDNYWEKFKLHFEKVHPDFFARLKTQFEDLTPHDLKLCAYIRMNLAGKDIAQILNISQKGVIMGRYRIKKKLKLSAEENLSEFIQKF